MAVPAVIEIDGLTKKYGGRVVVRGLSFSVVEQEIFGLLGPNGAGKTTTIAVLATLLAPDEGEVTICGHDLTREASRVKPLIGFVPQELALYPTLSAWDNLVFFGRIYGLPWGCLKERIAEVLEMVGLSDRAGDAVQTLSGGMKRRLNIAAGLIHRPRVLLLDEPTVGVDPQSRNFIFEYVQRLKSSGISVVYSTHYMEEAAHLCDRVAILDEGGILALDTPQGLINLLGGGVMYVRIPMGAMETLPPSIRALSHVRAVSVQDGRLKIETDDARAALLALIELCNARGVAILSLEVLEPTLESVFLHLTGKGLRD